MDRVFTRFVLWMLAMLALSQACAGCAESPDPLAIEVEPRRASAYPAIVVPRVPRATEPPRASLDLPDTCDVLLVRDTPSGRQLSKALPAWLGSDSARAAHQAETRRVVEIIASEMGADELAAEMLVRKAIYESSANPGSVHVHTADVAANRRASRSGRKSSSDRWSSATVSVYERKRGELVQVGDYDAWALGRGLYGMVTGLHMARWSTDAPPWSLCDPVVATVTAIWSMRAGLDRCHGTTLRDAYRRFSSGHCAVRDDDLERRFDRLARGHVRGLKLRRFDPDSRADFGTRWPEESTDRGVLLAHMRRRIAE